MLFGITKDWLVSKKACNILLWTAYGAIMMTLYLALLNITDVYLGLSIAHQIDSSAMLSSLETILIIPMIGGTAFLCVAMWVYWTKADESSSEAKTIWFFLMIFGVWLSAIIYYFAVYRRQVLTNLQDSSNIVQS